MKDFYDSDDMPESEKSFRNKTKPSVKLNYQQT